MSGRRSGRRSGLCSVFRELMRDADFLLCGAWIILIICGMFAALWLGCGL